MRRKHNDWKPKHAQTEAWSTKEMSPLAHVFTSIQSLPYLELLTQRTGCLLQLVGWLVGWIGTGIRNFQAKKLLPSESAPVHEGRVWGVCEKPCRVFFVVLVGTFCCLDGRQYGDIIRAQSDTYRGTNALSACFPSDHAVLIKWWGREQS